MTEPKDNGTLYILLGISGAVLLTVAGGWFLLDDGEPLPEAVSEPPPLVLPQKPPTPAAAAEETVDETSTDVETTDIDADLRKARLAAEADILAYPVERSALHFYGRVLAARPKHEIANAELDAVLGRLEQTANAHLEAEELDEAYELAMLVAQQRPGHPLVNNVQQTLNDYAGTLVEQAIQFAKDGKDSAASDALAAATALPGRNPEYFAAVSESITEIRASRIAATQDRQKRAQDASAQATAAWVAKVRNAIASGRLIEPAGENAVVFLAERQDADDRKQELTNELVSALSESTQTSLNFDQLETAESYLAAAEQLAGNTDELAALRAELEDAFIQFEANRVVSTDELVRVSIVPPNFPRRAARRGVSGWVELEFTVTTTGETSDIQVARAEPTTVFNQSAIDAVSQWTFEPKAYRGQIIAQRAAVRLKFALQ